MSASYNNEIPNPNFTVSDWEKDGAEEWGSLGDEQLKQFDNGEEYFPSGFPFETSHVLYVAEVEETEESLARRALPPKWDKIVRCPKKCCLPGGHASTGIVRLCIDDCWLANFSKEPVIAQLDSGPDLTLLSEKALSNLRNPPKLHKAHGFHLTGIAGGAFVKGYVNLKFWLRSKEGAWMEFQEEAWVLKDLKAPILLGEDFHVNYQISTI